MKNTIGSSITLTLFGESHADSIGAVIDGMPAGIPIDMQAVQMMMDRRRAQGTLSTARHEEDLPHFLCGVRNGYTEGTPIAIVIDNKDVHRSDYDELKGIARPGHADYAAQMKYEGWQDASGGGHFSGRLTAPLTAAGAIFMQMLRTKGIRVATHIQSIHGINDDCFEMDIIESQMDALNQSSFAAISSASAECMKQEIENARMHQDSVGGVLETIAVGLMPGIGEPAFDSLESELAHAMFSIPAVKGIEFGSGFHLADMKGSEANDPFRMNDGKIASKTNNSGGINGGISNGMPIVFRTAIKPTPSIGLPQKTVSFETNSNTDISIHGRHDPCIAVRAAAVQDSMTAFVLCDLLMQRFGTIFFQRKKS